MTDRPGRAGLVSTGLTKSYGGTPTIDSVDTAIHAGERHAVSGENGAGKSTLIKALGGLVAPDSGQVASGDGHAIASPQAARDVGVAIVHQHLSLIPQMSVEEKCVLLRFPTTRGFVDRRQVRTTAKRAMAHVELDLDPRRPVDELSFAERQLLEIGRALLSEPKVLILDEPTSAVTPGGDRPALRTPNGAQSEAEHRSSLCLSSDRGDLHHHRTCHGVARRQGR